MDKNKVKITMEDGGEIVVVLDEKNAPLRWRISERWWREGFTTA